MDQRKSSSSDTDNLGVLLALWDQILPKSVLDQNVMVTEENKLKQDLEKHARIGRLRVHINTTMDQSKNQDLE